MQQPEHGEIELVNTSRVSTLEAVESMIPAGYLRLKDVAMSCEVRDSVVLTKAISAAASTMSTGVDEIMDSGAVGEDDFLSKLAEMLHLEWIPNEITPDEDEDLLKKTFPAFIAVEHMVCPLLVTDDEMVVVCYDPLSLDARQAVSRLSNAHVTWKVASRRRVRDAISHMYGVGAGTFETVLEGRKDFDDEMDVATVIDDMGRLTSTWNRR